MRILFVALSYWPLWALQGLGGFIGWLAWIIPNKRRRTAIRNVSACFPELSVREQRRMARRAIGHELKTIAELPLIWLGSEKRVLRLVREYRGMELVSEAMKQNRGLILLTLHQGSFEGPAIPFSRDNVITGIYKPQKGSLDALAYQGRTRFKGGLVAAVGGGVRQKLLPLLADNQMTYFLPDQDPPKGRGVFAPFFGIQAHTPTLVSKLVHASGAPVLYFFGERLSWGRGYIMHFLPAPSEIADPDLNVSVAAVNAGAEACVRLNPEQYWWGYQRFRRRPEGEPDFY
jgi:KDO2-lipid IV(A) lauroyltransferase